MRLSAQEGLTGSIKLWESIVDQLFATFHVSDPYFFELIHAFLWYALVEVLLLGAQMAAQVLIHSGKHCALFVHLLIRGLTLDEDSIQSIVPVAHSGSRHMALTTA